jgi:hypothetical protein
MHVQGQVHQRACACHMCARDHSPSRSSLRARVPGCKHTLVSRRAPVDDLREVALEGDACGYHCKLVLRKAPAQHASGSELNTPKG